MEYINTKHDFSILEKLMFVISEDHSTSTLSKLKTEINKIFTKSKCKDILYTNNTDKLFFGMKVYPLFDGDDTMEIMGDSKTKIFDQYYIEFDSKLFDPMLGLTEKELTAVLLHEIGHIIYDIGTIDVVRKNVDLYFADAHEYVDLKASKGYKELIGYALKDAVMKVGSLFAKFRDEEIVADATVVACGYGPDLETALRKIRRSATYLNKDVDDRFITLAWVLRLRSEFTTKRIPAIHTLNRAKALTASQLEKRELDYAVKLMNKMDDPMSEGVIDNIKERFSKKVAKFKMNGVRSIRDDIYELNLRLRCAEHEDDLLFIIRTVNTDIAILQDYLSDDIDDYERQETTRALQDLYDIRQRASKDKKVRSLNSSLINVIYPD